MEIESQFSGPETATRNAHHQLVTLVAIGCFAAFPPSGLIVGFDHALTASETVVNKQVVAFPSGRMLPVGIDKQQHPIRIGMRSKRLRRFYVEIDILIVTRHLRLDNVVAPSRIHIRPGGEITRTVAVIRIARMIVISLFDLPPLVETAVQVDRYRFAGRFGLGNPFVLPDIGDQLVVIGR